MQKLSIDPRVSLCGTKKEIEQAEQIITAVLPDLHQLPEPRARLILQQIMDSSTIKASILFDGNSVWSLNRIIRDIKRVKKSGMEAMTDYLYKFLSLSCGSIAWTNKQGWISVYPTVDHLRNFFRKNEFGRRVKEHLPQRFTDSFVIVKEIESILGI